MNMVGCNRLYIRSIYCVLAIILCCVTMNVTILASTADYYTEGYFIYSIGQGEARIHSYFGDEKDVIIPCSLAGRPVTAIDSYAFAGCGGMESLTIPDTVQEVGDNAFIGADSLDKVINRSRGLAIPVSEVVLIVEDFPRYAPEEVEGIGGNTAKPTPEPDTEPASGPTDKPVSGLGNNSSDEGKRDVTGHLSGAAVNSQDSSTTGVSSVRNDSSVDSSLTTSSEDNVEIEDVSLDVDSDMDEAYASRQTEAVQAEDGESMKNDGVDFRADNFHVDSESRPASYDKPESSDYVSSEDREDIKKSNSDRPEDKNDAAGAADYKIWIVISVTAIIAVAILTAYFVKKKMSKAVET